MNVKIHSFPRFVLVLVVKGCSLVAESSIFRKTVKQTTILVFGRGMREA